MFGFSDIKLFFCVQEYNLSILNVSVSQYVSNHLYFVLYSSLKLEYLDLAVPQQKHVDFQSVLRMMREKQEGFNNMSKFMWRGKLI